MQNAYNFSSHCHEFQWSRFGVNRLNCVWLSQWCQSESERNLFTIDIQNSPENHFDRTKITYTHTGVNLYIHTGSRALTHTKLNRCDFVNLKPFRLLDLPTYILPSLPNWKSYGERNTAFQWNWIIRWRWTYSKSCTHKQNIHKHMTIAIVY